MRQDQRRVVVSLECLCAADKVAASCDGRESKGPPKVVNSRESTSNSAVASSSIIFLPSSKAKPDAIIEK